MVSAFYIMVCIAILRVTAQHRELLYSNATNGNSPRAGTRPAKEPEPQIPGM